MNLERLIGIAGNDYLIGFDIARPHTSDKSIVTVWKGGRIIETKELSRKLTSTQMEDEVEKVVKYYEAKIYDY